MENHTAGRFSSLSDAEEWQRMLRDFPDIVE
jgi:hypothetical protein